MEDNSAFSPDNLASATLITMARIYDLIAVLAINQAGNDDLLLKRVMDVINGHENGFVKMANPSFRE
jgi:hypothetical protein